MSLEAHSLSGDRLWLFSRRADFWLACGGASTELLAAILLITFHGDRELDALDFVLSEFHLGATYDAVIRRRLWRHSPVDVLVVPFVIVALTYAFSLNGQAILLTSIAMYAAIWHRGRQSLGVARYYQRAIGGPVSPIHEILFRGAIYLPMLAGLAAYTHFAPLEYEGEAYLALSVGKEMSWAIGLAAALWVIVYLIWTLWRNRSQPEIIESRNQRSLVHPGEWWVVLAHALAFGSGYVLGAANASFVLVLAVHHEVQYLYFAYAMARRPASLPARSNTGLEPVTMDSELNALPKVGRAMGSESKQALGFVVWPAASFLGALVGGWFKLEWITTLGTGGLFCHYWLDGRIWTRRLFQN